MVEKESSSLFLYNPLDYGYAFSHIKSDSIQGRDSGPFNIIKEKIRGEQGNDTAICD